MSDLGFFDGMGETSAKKCAFCLVLVATAFVAMQIKPDQSIGRVGLCQFEACRVLQLTSRTVIQLMKKHDTTGKGDFSKEQVQKLLIEVEIAKKVRLRLHLRGAPFLTNCTVPIGNSPPRLDDTRVCCPYCADRFIHGRHRRRRYRV
jgi:hypothetical protein